MIKAGRSLGTGVLAGVRTEPAGEDFPDVSLLGKDSVWI